MSVLILASVVLSSALGLAEGPRRWGFPQHRVVCEIAWAEMSPVARRAAAALLRTSGQYETFAESCVWADVSGARYHQNHWVNVPPGAATVTADDCPANGDCILNNLESEIRVLRTSADEAERLRALMFIGHFVGDLHQPLHVGYESDRGGNGTRIDGRGGGYDNLHKVWDRYFFRSSAGQPRILGQRLHAEIKAIDRTVWGSTQVTDWANESFRIVEDYVYDGLIEVDVNEGLYAFSDEYEVLNLHVAEMQLKKAGYRLGRLLNDIFAEG